MALVYGLLVMAGLLALGIAAVVLVARRRPRAVSGPLAHSEQLSPEFVNIRLLDNDEDVRGALEAAMAHERMVAREANRRVARYRRALDELTPAAGPGLNGQSAPQPTRQPARTPLRQVS